MIARTPYEDLPQALVDELSAAELDPRAIYDHIVLAFDEDLPGGRDDATSAAMPDMGHAVADIAAREPGVVAGLVVAELATDSPPRMPHVKWLNANPISSLPLSPRSTA